MDQELLAAVAKFKAGSESFKLPLTTDHNCIINAAEEHIACVRQEYGDDVAVAQFLQESLALIPQLLAAVDDMVAAELLYEEYLSKDRATIEELQQRIDDLEAQATKRKRTRKVYHLD